MLTQSSRSLLNQMARTKVIPVAESRAQLVQVLEHTRGRVVLLRHCNLFDCAPLLDSAQRRGFIFYANADHMDGINADAAGLQYLAAHLHISGIVSNNPKVLVWGKNVGLETIQRIFAVDSTGLETALETVDTHTVDLLDISPALVIPHIVPQLQTRPSLPFIGSGLITTQAQIQAILKAGAVGVTTLRAELWS
jgi:glycerol uptake operon antiterminator